MSENPAFWKDVERAYIRLMRAQGKDPKKYDRSTQQLAEQETIRKYKEGSILDNTACPPQ